MEGGKKIGQEGRIQERKRKGAIEEGRKGKREDRKRQREDSELEIESQRKGLLKKEERDKIGKRKQEERKV